MAKKNKTKQKKKKFIFLKASILGLVIAGLAFLALNMTQDKTIATSISMQFSGVEKGMYPDNTRFSHLDLVEEEVLDYVFDYSNLGFKESFIRAFTVEPVVPNGMIETLKKRRAAGEDYTYYPNEFIIKIKPDDSIGLTEDVAKTIAKNYEGAYTAFFNERFTFPFLDLQSLVDNFNYISYDYPEYEVVLDNLFNVIVGYLSILEKDAPTFVASNNMSFSSVKEGVNLTRKIDVPRISSMVHTYRLTKDLDELIMKYDYMIRQNELNRDMESRNIEVRRSLLQVVDNNKSTMMLEDVSGEAVGVSVVNKIYDHVASEVALAEKNAGNWTEHIVILENRINDLNGNLYNQSEISEATMAVENMTADLYAKIVSWVDEITTMSSQYFEKEYANAITSIYQVREIPSMSMIKSIIISLFIWLIVTFSLYRFRKGPTR